jgi:chitosanase
MMHIKNVASRLALALTLYGTAMGQQVEGPEYNKPEGTPGSFFTASGSIPVSAIQDAAAKSSVVPDLATYPIAHGSSVMSTIHGDWAQFSSVSAHLSS